MLSCSSESQKAKGKASRFPHKVYLSFIGKKSEKIKAEIDAVSV
jgi:hypothetical protein